MKALALDGVMPSAATLANGAYPYSKPLYLVTRHDLTAGAEQFIGFLRSAAGTAILTTSGHLATTANGAK